MNLYGRPKNLNPAGQRFLNLYLDPLFDSERICRELQISRSTFYNYENELGLPKLRVGLGVVSQKRGLRAFANLQDPGERYELQLIRHLGKEMGVRIKLVPFFSGTNSAVAGVLSKEVDFALSSLSWTKERAKTLYFSESYYRQSPWGHLMKLKESPGPSARTRPRLGVFRSSIHFEHASSCLTHEFEIKSYPSVPITIQALNDGKVDFILANPNLLSLYTNETASLELASAKIVYKSHTGVIFHADSEPWRKRVDRALSTASLQE